MEASFFNKVLIIDDRIEEALPIMQSLSKREIYTLYWDGKVHSKPLKPLEGVRLVFLDMRFSYVTDSRSIVSHLFTLMKHSISINNGPYILCVWSKHTNEYFTDFKMELENHTDVPRPFLITNIEKNQFIERIIEKNEIYEEIAATLEDNKNTEIKEHVLQILQNQGLETSERVDFKDDIIDRLLQHLDEKLKGMNSLAALLMWEDLVNKSTQNLVNEISLLSELDAHWDNNIKTLIQHLAAANAGKSLGETAKAYITNAFSTLNYMLPDALWNQLVQLEINEEDYIFIKEPAIKEMFGQDEYSITKKSKFVVKKSGSADHISFKSVSDISTHTDNEILIKLHNKYLTMTGHSNFKLLCESAIKEEASKPGGLYKIENGTSFAEMSSSIFKNSESINSEKNTLIKLDISSACDYAQTKLKRVRSLYGMMVEDSNFLYINETDDIYCTPNILIEGRIVKMVFNFHFVQSESQIDLKNEDKLLHFRELILTEIKNKLSSFVSRVGLINL
ncbi:hypothetical protein A8990_106133 [Paenibacillus taihuensis]|uniref:Response receiver domain-containing protein n=1 Tax=Paenibacillus taihuensis TaxID=1156355 RepID=A0A3D9SG78_9BACL|nr:hypothetical protein [Paenibacillus taihuensis]REE90628.1 hypothetical protein A8990_106133 [Paenibacillus taihuensis]